MATRKNTNRLRKQRKKDCVVPVESTSEWSTGHGTLRILVGQWGALLGVRTVVVLAAAGGTWKATWRRTCSVNIQQSTVWTRNNQERTCVVLTCVSIWWLVHNRPTYRLTHGGPETTRMTPHRCFIPYIIRNSAALYQTCTVFLWNITSL